MQIEVQTKDQDGNIVFQGTLTQREVQFVLNIGVNFLLANGASPFLPDTVADAAPGSDQIQ